MQISAIDATRDYVNDARSKNIGALSPVAVARRLSVTVDQAIALLNCIAETEGLIKINGYLSCPDCNEVIPLKGKSLSAIVSEAETLADTHCPFL